MVVEVCLQEEVVEAVLGYCGGTSHAQWLLSDRRIFSSNSISKYLTEYQKRLFCRERTPIYETSRLRWGEVNLGDAFFNQSSNYTPGSSPKW